MNKKVIMQYAVEGDDNSIQVKGSFSSLYGDFNEWLEALHAIESKRSFQRKRLGFHFREDSLILWCPRNAEDDDDVLTIPDHKIADFTEKIENCLNSGKQEDQSFGIDYWEDVVQGAIDEAGVTAMPHQVTRMAEFIEEAANTMKG